MFLLEDQALIGARIRRIREEIFGETREQFSKRCNIGKGYLGKVERGEILISTKAVLNIVAATQADIRFIMFGKVNQKLTKKRKRLLKIIETCSTEEIDDYFDYVCKQRCYRLKIANNYKFLSQQFIKKHMGKHKNQEIVI